MLCHTFEQQKKILLDSYLAVQAKRKYKIKVSKVICRADGQLTIDNTYYNIGFQQPFGALLWVSYID